MELICKFLDQSETFCLGFEAGQIYTFMDKGELLTNHLIHIKNSEQYKHFGEKLGYTIIIKPYCDTWGYLTTFKELKN